MGLIQETLDLIKSNQEQEFNSIPFRFSSLEDSLNGINHGTYHLVGGYSGSGKTTFADDLFLFSAYDWIQKNPNVEATWFYYSFEINKHIKLAKAASRRIYHTTGLQLNVNYLLSRGIKNRISDEHYKLVIDNLNYYEGLEDALHIIDEPTNGYQVWEDVYNFCTNPNFADVTYEEVKTKEGKTKKRIVSYKRKKPNHFVFVMIDHASLIDSGGQKLKDAMDKLSTHLVYFRNKFNVIPVVIQQVKTEAINRSAQLANKIDIGPDDFSDSSYLYRDCNICLTLIAPFMFDMQKYRGYEVNKNFRYVKVIKSRDGNTYFGKGMYLNGIAGTVEELPTANDLTAQDYKDIETFNYTKKTLF